MSAMSLCVFLFVATVFVMFQKSWSDVIVLALFELLWGTLVVVSCLAVFRVGDLTFLVAVVSYLSLAAVELVITAYLLLLLSR